MVCSCVINSEWRAKKGCDFLWIVLERSKTMFVKNVVPIGQNSELLNECTK